MTNNKKCNFELDPEDSESWDRPKEEIPHVKESLLNKEGIWTCPHDQHGKKNSDGKCIFHMDPDDKDDDKVIKQFISVLENISADSDKEQSTRENQFCGCKFGEFDLSGHLPLPKIDKSVILNYSDFNGKFDVSEINFNFPIKISGSRFHKSSEFTAAKFESPLEIRESKLFYSSFAGAEFDSVDFTSTEFSNRVSFANARFNDISLFMKCEFPHRTRFNKTEFKNKANFKRAEFDVNFDKNTTMPPTFREADLTGVDFTGISLHNVNFESALLSRALLLSTDLRGAKLSGAVLGDVRVNDNTQFLGLPSNNTKSSRHTITALLSKSYCVYDPNYEGNNSGEGDRNKAKEVYQALEELSKGAALPHLQSQCFVRRQDIQKDSYWADMKESDTNIEKMIAGARYSRAKTARVTLLYGESPWRIIFGSVGFIVLIALLYPLNEWLKPVGGEPITYNRIFENPELIFESLYFSTLTFTTLGMGDYNPIGFGQVLATLNTTFGAVLIALLVFVLGRRAAR